MKPVRLILGLVAAAPLAACASGFDSTVVPAASYIPLQPPAQGFAGPDEVVAFYLDPIEASVSERQYGDYPGDAGDRLLVFSAEGLRDDSISAQQWRVLLQEDASGLRIVSVGLRQRCARSGSDEWTNAPCP